MTLSNSERAKEWVQAALIRAIQIERDHAEAQRELTPHARKRRQRATEPANPEWYSSDKFPIQDPPNILKMKLSRKAAGNWSTLGHVNRPVESEAA